MASLGRGILLAKVDLKSAYRIVPIHPEDRPLMGMQWKGDYMWTPAYLLDFGLLLKYSQR